MKSRKATKLDIKDLSKLFDKYRIFYENKTDVETAEKFLNQRLQNGESEIFVAENEERHFFHHELHYALKRNPLNALFGK